jgi:DNA polymerase delta subunit 1
MANICSTPISFLILRGQGIKLHSYVGKICRQEGVLMPDIEKGERFVFDGAYVLTPKRDMYVDNPVTTLDYASLYPSIASGWGFSTDGKVWTMDYDLDGNETGGSGMRDPKNPNNFLYDNLPGYRYVESTYPLKKGTKKKCWVVGSRRCRWAIALDGRQTIIPKVVTVLMGERAATRKQIKTEPDPFTANILDKRQLGYKVSANSVYGQTGSSVSAFADVDVAASITSVGRLMIIYARTVIERVYADSIYVSERHGTARTRSSYVYGDTDSVFSTFNLEDPVTGQPIRGERALAISIELAKEAAVLASMFLPPPMKLTYEKTFLNFIILSKKRYVGILYDDDHTEGYLKFMGLQIKKRDTCDCVKDIFGDIMMMFINNPTNVGSIINYFNTALEQIISGELPIEKFIQTKSLRGSYANPLGIAHNVLANRIGDREPGTRPKPGDRIGYAFVKTKLAPGSGSGKDGKILNGDKIETLAYIKQHKLEIDYDYYITNHVKKPLLQMFGLALLPILKHLGQTKEIETYYTTMSNFTQKAEGDLAIFNVHAEKYCAQAISAILFEPFIRKLYCKSNRLQPITSFFAPRTTTTTTTTTTTANKLASYSGVEKANFR